jgi:hypothetical protein
VGHRIQSGHPFVLKTDDPVTHVLPSYTLLEIPWKFSHIVALSAAAGTQTQKTMTTSRRPITKKIIDKWLAEPSDDAIGFSLQQSDITRLSLTLASIHYILSTKNKDQHRGSSSISPGGCRDFP